MFLPKTDLNCCQKIKKRHDLRLSKQHFVRTHTTAQCYRHKMKEVFLSKRLLQLIEIVTFFDGHQNALFPLISKPFTADV